MKRHDRTKPVPAPKGYKWVISQSGLNEMNPWRDVDLPVLELGLWPTEAKVTDRGMRFDGGHNEFAHARGHFTKARQIRRTSERTLRDWRRSRAAEHAVDELLGEIS